MPPSQRWVPPWPITQTQAGNDPPAEKPRPVDKLHGILNGRKMGAPIVMMIHGALWIECPKAEERKARHLWRRMMAAAGKPYLNVPLEVDFG